MKLIITADRKAYREDRDSITKRTIELENGSEHSLLIMALENYKRNPFISDEQHEEIEKVLRDLNSPEIEVVEGE